MLSSKSGSNPCNSPPCTIAAAIAPETTPGDIVSPGHVFPLIAREGGVLVVNTAVGALGEGAASLVGATLLNLLGLIVEEQRHPGLRGHRQHDLLDRDVDHLPPLTLLDPRSEFGARSRGRTASTACCCQSTFS